MVKKTQWIWYRTNDDVRDASLFNCRERDLSDGDGIAPGTIIEGQHGFVAAESAVANVTGAISSYQPNRRLEWQGSELRCMAKDNPIQAPGQLPCCNYVVAELPDVETQKLARQLAIPVLQLPDGKSVINLEIDRFKGQRKNRRGTLL